MSVTENIDRIEQGKTSIITSIKSKGVNVPSGVLINEIAPYINEIQSGSGGDVPKTELEQKYEGATVFRINIPTDNYEFAINLCNNASTATYDVDWGDGGLESGLTTDEQHHTYAKAGIYDVNVYNLSKDITLGGKYSVNSFNNSSVTIYYLFNNTNNDSWGFRLNETKDNLTVSNILIGDKITTIGGNAFYNCSSLQSVVITEGVTTIAGHAFYNCSSLQSVVIPEGFTTINSNVFNQCSSLQSVVMPEGVTTIGNSAFSSCTSLQSVVIPNSVTTIGGSAFNQCYSLQSVVIPEGVTTIDNNAFYQCSSLQSVVIPEGVTTIGSYVFSNCYSLQSVVIPEGVTTIGGNVFNSCSSLQSITVNALTAPTIQSSTFPTSSFKYTKRYLYVPKDSVGYNEGNWKTYLIDKGWELRYIEEHIKTPTTMKLKTVNNFLHKWDCIGGANLVDYELVNDEYIYHFDDKIEEIIQYTFYNEKLKEIELPEGVTTIGDSTFYNCSSLQSVVIPEGVTTIGNSAFNSCTYLQTITVNALTAPTILSSTFSSVGTKVPSGTPKILRVPKGATGYDTGNWKITLINYGYTLEYIEPEKPIEPDNTEYTDMLFFAPRNYTTNVQVKISEDCIVDEFKYTTSPLLNTDIKSLNYDELNYPTVSKGETIEISSLSGTHILWKGALRNSSSVDTPIFEIITDTEENNEVQVAGELNNGSFDYAYYYMFRGNTALSYIGTGLVLTSEYVGISAYQNMFFNCTNFNDGGDIHISAKVVDAYGLGAMFSGCNSLKTAPSLSGIKEVGTYGMAYMFANTAITTAPVLSATTVSPYSTYQNIFEGCLNLNYVKIALTEWNTTITPNWLSGVASEGTIETNATNIPTGSSGVPNGWTVKPIEPTVPIV